MTQKTTEIIQSQLLEVLSQLPVSWQEQVLDFTISLHQKKLTQQWNAISDEEAAMLKAEFAEEDLAFAQAALADYLPLLQKEDKV
ncbi:hypothetical protein WA1_09525 [Scytonema hofmannii PCC 7110]|uniref:DUF2281 domain-containing protein n=1 Tax=Scytonema hofmannii PCC 7110 TaxID=128403 RepID=A0A139WRC7_9CYAN|nr:hypothetical protein [Scytonema hofmannii]KYC34979.1 hypothetical protein WA1_09525 [Scytonema hofmannii PCC 7110]